MMLPTHVLGGMLLAAPLVRVAPELAPIGFVAGFLGGLFPDLDMYVGHRKTLHFPVYYSAFAALALFAALAVPSAATVGAALFLLGAAVHSVADMYGGGLELRPWEGNSDRAVYDHYRGTWIAPRQLVRYDGAVEDLALSIGLSLPLLYLLNGLFQQVVLGTLVVAAVYTMTRRHLAELAAWITPYAPDALLPFLPDRYHDDDPKQ
ncbi:membrane protein [Halorubrum lacusprofundi]|jgi:GNAT superfamily N-acetyltransferase|uniref:Membrane-bound metal-dependent hydrolase n=1 Tax=Halorubrum lacusprofundi (strain ATCC 49239 / DSM 5036 / JCM 8891 / ACAM 34) TaxID=416348 RepID=B9LPT1_HALLT|nr:membrane protein [Halorubrum lacusprofundi]ACM57369.1 membrane-bound metal-dependent hydrolase [Halorubrum lacusprofundi ATCC 49239]MCG1006029.1 metal-dependent hydrolase [Halorubrum lacusprofundi]